VAGFFFKIEQEDGIPADPSTLHTAVPNWALATRFQLAETGPSASSKSGPGAMRTTTPVLVVEHV
jgi:hypothetical protein